MPTTQNRGWVMVGVMAAFAPIMTNVHLGSICLIPIYFDACVIRHQEFVESSDYNRYCGGQKRKWGCPDVVRLPTSPDVYLCLFTLPSLPSPTVQYSSACRYCLGAYSLGRQEEGTVTTIVRLHPWGPRSFHPRGRHICRWLASSIEPDRIGPEILQI